MWKAILKMLFALLIFEYFGPYIIQTKMNGGTIIMLVLLWNITIKRKRLNGLFLRSNCLSIVFCFILHGIVGKIKSKVTMASRHTCYEMSLITFFLMQQKCNLILMRMSGLCSSHDFSGLEYWRNISSSPKKGLCRSVFMSLKSITDISLWVVIYWFPKWRIIIKAMLMW